METNWRGSGHESLQGAIPAIAWKEETDRQTDRQRERERERESKKPRKFVRRDVPSMRVKHGTFQIKDSPMTKLYSIQYICN